MKEMDRTDGIQILDQRCAKTMVGPGSFAVDGEIKLLTPEKTIVYLHSNHISEGDHFTVAEFSYYDWMTMASQVKPGRVDFLEHYETFKAAAASQYGKYFRLLDKLIDEYLAKEGN